MPSSTHKHKLKNYTCSYRSHSSQSQGHIILVYYQRTALEQNKLYKRNRTAIHHSLYGLYRRLVTITSLVQNQQSRILANNLYTGFSFETPFKTFNLPKW